MTTAPWILISGSFPPWCPPRGLTPIGCTHRDVPSDHSQGGSEVQLLSHLTEPPLGSQSRFDQRCPPRMTKVWGSQVKWLQSSLRCLRLDDLFHFYKPQFPYQENCRSMVMRVSTGSRPPYRSVNLHGWDLSLSTHFSMLLSWCLMNIHYAQKLQEEYFNMLNFCFLFFLWGKKSD